MTQIHPHKTSAKKQGFTLIELSIVLVIIGLIVGGVLVGQDLIKAAERRLLYATLQEFSAGMNAFELKYGCIPGDCKNATTFFGKNTTLCNGDTGSAGSPGTCNGNGNKRIERKVLVSDPDESLHFFNQLVLAGYVGGFEVDDVRVPTLNKIFDGNNFLHSSEVTFPVYGSNNITLGAAHYLFGESDSEFKGTDCAGMLAFDVAYDDGKPNTGSIMLLAEEGETEFYCADNENNRYDITDEGPYGGNHTLAYKLR